MKALAIIVAAGSGTRLGASVEKAFVPLNGATLLALNLRTISEIQAIGEVIITVPQGLENRAREIASAMQMRIPIKIVAGGQERQDSVWIALAYTSKEAELIVIHDAARPLATATLFDSCIRQADTTGAAIAAVPLADTLKRVAAGNIQETIPRAGLWQAQTPQVFRRNLIIKAHENALNGAITATDDADLVERIGEPVAVIESSPLNFKITTAEDLNLAEMILAAQFLR